MKHQLARVSHIAIVLLLGLGFAQEPLLQSSSINTHPLRGNVQPVEGATAELLRTPAGLTMNFLGRELNPGHAYTVWWVVINAPQNCAGPSCTIPEVLGSNDVIQANATNAGGAIADEHGIANIFSHLSPGALPGGWWSSDFVDPYGVEVHLVLNDHGPVLEGMEEEMISTYRGGCTDESLPAAFPDTAKRDGAAGPNSCLLFQFAIFTP